MKNKETVRLTIDFPVEQHRYLKTKAAQRGISMREYIIESLVDKDSKFRNALTKVVKDNDELLRRLADK